MTKLDPSLRKMIVEEATKACVTAWKIVADEVEKLAEDAVNQHLAPYRQKALEYARLTGGSADEVLENAERFAAFIIKGETAPRPPETTE